MSDGGPSATPPGSLRASCEPCPDCGCPGEQYDGHVCEDFADGVPLVKGPTTFTTACNCDSTLPGYHRMNCGVYA